MSLVTLSFPLILLLYFAFIIWLLQLLKLEAIPVLQRYSALFYALLLVVFVSGLALQPEVQLQPTILLVTTPLLSIVFGLLALLSGYALFKGEAWLIAKLSSAKAKAQQQAKAHQTVQQQAARWWMLPVTVLIVLIEELIWRVYLPVAIRTEWPMSWLVAGIIASVAFGLHHLFYGWIHVLLKSGYGLIWLLLYQVSGAFLVPVLSHLAFNLAVCYCRDSKDHRSSCSLKKAV